MPIEAVKKYLSSASSVKTPYFLAVGDQGYKEVRDKLLEMGLVPVNVSAFCGAADKWPDEGGLLDRLKDAGDNKLAVLGLGEYLALRGKDEAARFLLPLKDMAIGDGKVVLLLRGVAAQITDLQTDPRFDTRHFSILANADCDLSIGNSKHLPDS